MVLTGAGISTESGIPDFRGPAGRLDQGPRGREERTLQYYVADPELRTRTSGRTGRQRACAAGEPNAGHLALAELERKGARRTRSSRRTSTACTIAAGTSPEIVVEIHGNVREAKCMACGWRGPMDETLDRVRAGEEDPACLDCGGILKSATISFGENLVPEDLAGRSARPAVPTCSSRSARRSASTRRPALPEIALRNGARS